MQDGEWILATKSSKKNPVRVSSDGNVRIKNNKRSMSESISMEIKRGKGDKKSGHEKDVQRAGTGGANTAGQKGWGADIARGGNTGTGEKGGGQKKTLHAQPQQVNSNKKKNKPTKNLGLFDLIEAQLSTTAPKKKTPQSSSNSIHQQNQTMSNPNEKKLPVMVEKVKVMKMKDDQPTNEFVVIKKQHKKKLSTLKKRILLVCQSSARPLLLTLALGTPTPS